MDRNVWMKTRFTIGNLPQWICPNCHKGWLEFDKTKFKRIETASSKEWRKNEHSSFDEISYVFTGFLKCSNTRCKEVVVVSGIGEVTEVDIDSFGDSFIPEYFTPPLHLFKIPESCPQDIESQIISAFRLFWIDEQSCANKIRIAIEAILNEQRVKKYEKIVGSNKEKSLSLHKRLEYFKSKQPKIADQLIALKWIGNVGSHIGTIHRTNLIDAFEILEDSIEKLYDLKEKRLTALIKSITKSKGVGYKMKNKT